MIPILKTRRSQDSGVTGASWLPITGNPIVCSTVCLGQQPKKSRRLNICPLRRVASQRVSNAASTSMPWHYHVNVTYVLRGSVYLLLCHCVSPYTAWIPETFAVDFALGCTSKELWTCFSLCYVLLCFSTVCFAHDRHVQVSMWSQKHEDVIKWKHFPRHWSCVRGIHWSPVNISSTKWRGALMFSLIFTWTNSWANNGDAGDLRRHHAHYDVIVMAFGFHEGKLPRMIPASPLYCVIDVDNVRIVLTYIP